MRTTVHFQEFELRLLGKIPLGGGPEQAILEEEESGSAPVDDTDDVAYDWFADMEFDVGVGD